ncbi:MAG TPA: hypothetical protein VD932_02810, partial [Aquabacterium sp.]|nr:hypothetical protein [Aquabacterium sp.]
DHPMSEPLTDEELDDLKAFASRPYLGNMLMIDHITVLRLVEEVRRLRRECRLDLDEPTRCESVRCRDPYVRCVLMVGHHEPHQGSDESRWPIDPPQPDITVDAFRWVPKCGETID